MNDDSLKEYLGDAVYAEIKPYAGKPYAGDFFELILTTEDGYSATNTIVLEPEIVLKLERFISGHIKRK